MVRIFNLILGIILLSGCASTGQKKVDTSNVQPSPSHEWMMRGVSK